MDGHRFDRMAKTLAGGASLRAALRLLVGGALATPLGGSVAVEAAGICR